MRQEPPERPAGRGGGPACPPPAPTRGSAGGSRKAPSPPPPPPPRLRRRRCRGGEAPLRWPPRRAPLAPSPVLAPGSSASRERLPLPGSTRPFGLARALRGAPARREPARAPAAAASERIGVPGERAEARNFRHRAGAAAGARTRREGRGGRPKGVGGEDQGSAAYSPRRGASNARVSERKDVLRGPLSMCRVQGSGRDGNLLSLDSHHEKTRLPGKVNRARNGGRQQGPLTLQGGWAASHTSALKRLYKEGPTHSASEKETLDP